MWNFIKSSSSKENWLEHNFNEVCFVGRSNVGKSSLINALSNNNKLAKTSKTPGRTQLINYFDSNEGVMIVDLPGYGFAKVSKTQKTKMHDMMDEYFTESPKLSQIFLLFDTRHGMLQEDLVFYNYLIKIGHDVVLVGTKMDRTTQSERSKILKSPIVSTINPENIFLCSSKTKKNIDKLKKFIYSFKFSDDK
ncbi:MAG: YihA family ribosome biogenesis GTP-binding protein [Mycoplasmataceae bacterium]|nr:YihA family ribosome biogenesis GTP-binding protein [Mycoplasmataceae bacterium]